MANRLAASPVEFVEVPLDADGQPLNVTRSDDDYSLYLDWLADYLYRPSAAMPAFSLSPDMKRFLTPSQTSIIVSRLSHAYQ